MAAIDKIYGNRWQYEEFEQWCSKNYRVALEYFYKWDWDNMDSEEIHCITNFPTEIDKYLLNYCPIDWVKEQIKDQYCIDGVHDLMAFLNEEDE
jgi:hypothetical protein